MPGTRRGRRWRRIGLLAVQFPISLSPWAGLFYVPACPDNRDQVGREVSGRG